MIIPRGNRSLASACGKKLTLLSRQGNSDKVFEDYKKAVIDSFDQGLKAKSAILNQEVKLKSRDVTIHEFSISYQKLPEVDFKISCSKGTYIRSLARDYGEKLGVGAYLKKLVRTRIGPYALNDAEELDTFITNHANGGN